MQVFRTLKNRNLYFKSTKTPGVLTLTCHTYTCMCLPCGVLFHEFWYSDGGGFITDEGAQLTF